MEEKGPIISKGIAEKTYMALIIERISIIDIDSDEEPPREKLDAVETEIKRRCQQDAPKLFSAQSVESFPGPLHGRGI